MKSGGIKKSGGSSVVTKNERYSGGEYEGKHQGDGNMDYLSVNDRMMTKDERKLSGQYYKDSRYK